MLLQVNGLCVISSFHLIVRCSLLCEFRLFRMKNPYLCVGATYRFHLEGAWCHIQGLTFEDGTDRLFRNVVKQLLFHVA